MAVVGHATPPAYPPRSTHDWSSVLLEKLGHESVLLSSGASFFSLDGGSLTIPRLTVDADAAAWIASGEEFPTDDVQGDSIKLEPRKLGIVTGIDAEAIEDASVATLDLVGNSLAKATATKLDARPVCSARSPRWPTRSGVNQPRVASVSVKPQRPTVGPSAGNLLCARPRAFSPYRRCRPHHPGRCRRHG